MTKLSDLQLILLSAAAGHDDRSVLPFPESVAGDRARTARSVPALLRRGLIAEVAVDARAPAWREEGDQRYGLVITDAGLAAIGAGEAEPQPDAPPVEPVASAAPRTSKTMMVLDLLRRGEGATLAELVEATGWLPHTTRAALTGLRKNGHVIDKGKRDEATCYRIAEAG